MGRFSCANSSMAFSRTSRIDRRRRVMLDAVAADAEYAVESVRAKKRSLGREKQDSFDESFNGTKYRDPGYSQAVRRTCQQRMVQLIPIRRGTLTVVQVSRRKRFRDSKSRQES